MTSAADTPARCEADVKGPTTIQRIATFRQCPETATHVAWEPSGRDGELVVHRYCAKHAAGAKRRAGTDPDKPPRPVAVRKLHEPAFVAPDGLTDLLARRYRAVDELAAAKHSLNVLRARSHSPQRRVAAVQREAEAATAVHDLDALISALLG